MGRSNSICCETECIKPTCLITIDGLNVEWEVETYGQIISLGYINLTYADNGQTIQIEDLRNSSGTLAGSFTIRHPDDFIVLQVKTKCGESLCIPCTAPSCGVNVKTLGGGLYRIEWFYHQYLSPGDDYKIVSATLNGSSVLGNEYSSSGTIDVDKSSLLDKQVLIVTNNCGKTSTCEWAQACCWNKKQLKVDVYEIEDINESCSATFSAPVTLGYHLSEYELELQATGRAGINGTYLFDLDLTSDTCEFPTEIVNDANGYPVQREIPQKHLAGSGSIYISYFTKFRQNIFYGGIDSEFLGQVINMNVNYYVSRRGIETEVIDGTVRSYGSSKYGFWPYLTERIPFDCTLPIKQASIDVGVPSWSYFYEPLPWKYCFQPGIKMIWSTIVPPVILDIPPNTIFNVCPQAGGLIWPHGWGLRDSEKAFEACPHIALRAFSGKYDHYRVDFEAIS